MSDDNSEFLKLKYSQELEITKIGLSAALTLLGVGIATSWYSQNRPEFAWGIVAIIAYGSAIGASALSAVSFGMYLKHLKKYIELEFGADKSTNNKVHKVTAEPKVPEDSVFKLFRDSSDVFWIKVAEVIGVAALTGVIVTPFIRQESVPPSVWVTGVALGFSGIFFGALDKILGAKNMSLKNLKWSHKVLFWSIFTMLLIMFIISLSRVFRLMS